MITQLILMDNAAIIEKGEEGILLSENITVSSVFCGTIYEDDVYLCTLMCRRELSTTSDFMAALGKVLYKFNSNNLALKPISFEVAGKTDATKHYPQCTGLHGIHHFTDVELMDNLNTYFGIERVRLHRIIRFAPGSDARGRTSKVTVFKDGRVEIARVRHLQATADRIRDNASTVVEPPQHIGPAIRQVISLLPLQVNMDEARVIRVGERGLLYADNIQVCTVFIGKIYQNNKYQGTIMCRRGVGSLETFSNNVNIALKAFINPYLLVFKPSIIRTGITTDTSIYKASCKTTNTSLPKVLGIHGRTDEELIFNLCLLFRLNEKSLKDVVQPAFGPNSDVIACRVEVDSTGDQNYTEQTSAVYPITPAAPTAPVASCSTAPLPTLSLTDNDFL